MDQRGKKYWERDCMIWEAKERVLWHGRDTVSPIIGVKIWDFQAKCVPARGGGDCDGAQAMCESIHQICADPEGELSSPGTQRRRLHSAGAKVSGRAAGGLL